MKKFFLLLLIGNTLFSCATRKTAQIPQTSNHAAADSLSAAIGQIYRQGSFNGFSVAIVDENGPLYEQGFGFSDVSTNKAYTEKTVQSVASVSKIVVGIALLKAQELGKLNLDDPIDKYLPFKVRNPNFPEIPITIQHLATHTSSIADNDYYLAKNYILLPGQSVNEKPYIFDETQVFNTPDSLISLTLFLENALSEKGKWFQTDNFLTSKPGEIYEYSNIGTTLAALVLERATGISFTDFTKEHIFIPLTMTNSGWKYGEIKQELLSRLYEKPTVVLPSYTLITYPDGGLLTSVHDLGKLLTELIKGYNGNGKILTPASYREYFRPQLSASNFTDRNEQNPYNESYNSGIFIGFGYSGYIGHTGGDPGVLSILFFHPETQIGRIMIFNTSISDQAGNDAFYGIWNLLEKYQHKLKTKM